MTAKGQETRAVVPPRWGADGHGGLVWHRRAKWHRATGLGEEVPKRPVVQNSIPPYCAAAPVVKPGTDRDGAARGKGVPSLTIMRKARAADFSVTRARTFRMGPSAGL